MTIEYCFSSSRIQFKAMEYEKTFWNPRGVRTTALESFDVIVPASDPRKSAPEDILIR